MTTTRTSRPRRKAFAAAAAGALALALALTACSSSKKASNPTGNGNGTSTSGAGAAGTNDINRQPRDKVLDGGTLRWPEASIPANWNYNEVDGTDQATGDLILALLPQAFYADAKGVPRPNTNLLTSGKVTATSPQQVVTLEINPKATWSDGTPISEADFEAQWKALNGTNPAYTVSSTVGYDQIASVAKGAGDHEVVITFAKPFSDWQSLFAPLYPASTNSNPDVFNHGWEEKFPVSAGPFKFDSLDQTAKTVTIVRDDKWWGDKAKLDKIIFRTIDQDAQSDSLANGEIDLQIGIGSHVAYYQKVKTIPGVTVHRAAGPVWSNLTLNAASGPLADPAVRRAVTIGVNRKQIDQAIVGPLGVSTDPLNNHVFFTNQQGYTDNSGDLGKFDPDAAKKALDAAGWTSGDGGRTRAKAGVPLELKLPISSSADTAKQVAEIVQSQLADIGVKIDIVPVASKDFYPKYVDTGDFDIAQVTLGGNAYPISTAVPVFVKPKTAKDGTLDIQQNYSRIGTDEIDQLFAQATSDLDPAKAIADANAADVKLWQLDAIIPLYQRPQVVATKSTLANLGAPGVEDTVIENVGFTAK